MEDRKVNVTANGGLGIIELLQVAFVVLKLCKIIKWSWVWVLAPTWIGASLAVIFIIVLVIITKYR